MLVRDMPFRDTLQDLRVAMLRRLTLVALLVMGLAAYATLFASRFPADLLVMFLAAGGVIILMRRYLTDQLNLTRYSFIVLLHLTLFGAMLLTGAGWLPFLGVVLVLVSGMTTSYLHWLSAVTIFGVTALLKNGDTAYPLGELAVTLGVTVVVMQVSVATLYTALTWYSTMQKRADLLLEQTRQRQSELAQTVKSLEIAYQNMQRMQRQLVFAQRQADEARGMKERFAANISHELRTPLNLILGFSEIMVLTPEVYGGNRFAPKLTRDLYQIYSSSRHLLAMIDDVLDLSQIELSSFALNLERTNLNGFMDESAELFGNIFRDGKLRFTVLADQNLPEVEIDRTRIRQVLLNLLGNAHRFTENGGSVTLGVREQSGSIAFSVTDTGRGIPADKLPYIFDEFYQVDYSLSRSHGGAGLGLAICKRFVERHGGYVTVTSEEGVGSTFTFTLPVRSGSGVALPAAGDAQAEARTVLVLDRDPLVASLIRRHLTAHKVVQVADRAALTECIDLYQPLAVIVNQKPGEKVESGTDNRLGGVPTVYCSLPSAAWMIEQMQVQGFLPKPFSTQQLDEQLRQIGGVKQILVVDDDMGFVQLVQRSLETLPGGYEVIRAYDGQQALEVMAENRPDVMLLDLVMPEMDGFALVEVVRKSPETADLPIILLTATRYVREDAEVFTSMVIDQPGGLRPAEVLGTLRAVVDQFSGKN